MGAGSAPAFADTNEKPVCWVEIERSCRYLLPSTSRSSAPAVRTGVGPGAHALAEVELGPLEVIAHERHHVRHGQLLVRLDPERERRRPLTFLTMSLESLSEGAVRRKTFHTRASQKRSDSTSGGP